MRAPSMHVLSNIRSQPHKKLKSIYIFETGHLCHNASAHASTGQAPRRTEARSKQSSPPNLKRNLSNLRRVVVPQPLHAGASPPPVPPSPSSSSAAVATTPSSVAPIPIAPAARGKPGPPAPPRPRPDGSHRFAHHRAHGGSDGGPHGADRLHGRAGPASPAAPVAAVVLTREARAPAAVGGVLPPSTSPVVVAAAGCAGAEALDAVSGGVSVGRWVQRGRGRGRGRGTAMGEVRLREAVVWGSDMWRRIRSFDSGAK